MGIENPLVSFDSDLQLWTSTYVTTSSLDFDAFKISRLRSGKDVFTHMFFLEDVVRQQRRRLHYGPRECLCEPHEQIQNWHPIL